MRPDVTAGPRLRNRSPANGAGVFSAAGFSVGAGSAPGRARSRVRGEVGDKVDLSCSNNGEPGALFFVAGPCEAGLAEASYRRVLKITSRKGVGYSPLL